MQKSLKPLMSEDLLKSTNELFSMFLKSLPELIEEICSFELTNEHQTLALNSILNRAGSLKYSCRSFSWATQVEKAVELIDLLSDWGEVPEEREEISSELFDFWNETDFTEEFKTQLEANKEIHDISKDLYCVFTDSLISFFGLHLTTSFFEVDQPLAYIPTNELGEYNQYFHWGEDHDLFVVNHSFRFLAFDPESKEAHLFNTETSSEVRIFATSPCRGIKLSDDKLIPILPCDEDSRLNIDLIVEKLETAKNKLRETNKDYFQSFSQYTEIISPFYTSGMVSYSQQSLPGVSCINFLERDEVDLLDDLLHEHGHHILNHFLNRGELFNSDDETLYYSPWREVARPIRGIFHAHCTFVWALKLFSDLSKNKPSQRVKKRFVEEFFMLRMTQKTLEAINFKDLISKEGREVLSIYNTIIADEKNHHQTILSELPGFHEELVQYHKNSFEKLDLEKSFLHI